MKRLSDAVAPVTSRSFERKYIALGRIVKCWPDIIGKQLAVKAQPVKIHYRKATQNKKASATLEIAVSSADATLLHYQKDLILQRLNHLFGDSWITAIKFVPIADNDQIRFKAPRRNAAKRPLTQAQKKTLSAVLEDIEDNDILSSLSSLGEHVMMKEGHL